MSEILNSFSSKDEIPLCIETLCSAYVDPDGTSEDYATVVIQQEQDLYIVLISIYIEEMKLSQLNVNHVCSYLTGSHDFLLLMNSCQFISMWNDSSVSLKLLESKNMSSFKSVTENS